MEQDLFDWDGWDGDPECMQFYHTKLKVAIGEFPIGTEFPTICILQNSNKGSGVLQLYNEEDCEIGQPTAEFKLTYLVGEKLD